MKKQYIKIPVLGLALDIPKLEGSGADMAIKYGPSKDDILIFDQDLYLTVLEKFLSEEGEVSLPPPPAPKETERERRLRALRDSVILPPVPRPDPRPPELKDPPRYTEPPEDDPSDVFRSLGFQEEKKPEYSGVARLNDEASRDPGNPTTEDLKLLCQVLEDRRVKPSYRQQAFERLCGLNTAKLYEAAQYLTEGSRLQIANTINLSFSHGERVQVLPQYLAAFVVGKDLAVHAIEDGESVFEPIGDVVRSFQLKGGDSLAQSKSPQETDLGLRKENTVVTEPNSLESTLKRLFKE